MTAQSTEHKCPVCEATHRRAHRLSNFEYSIIDELRRARLIKRDSCILCVQKHVGRAMTYHKELLTAIGSCKSDGTSSVNIKLNHLSIIGHLGCAIEESDNFEDLQNLLIEQERNYRYYGEEPDWGSISALIIEYEQAIEAAGAVK